MMIQASGACSTMRVKVGNCESRTHHAGLHDGLQLFDLWQLPLNAVPVRACLRRVLRKVGHALLGDAWAGVPIRAHIPPTLPRKAMMISHGASKLVSGLRGSALIERGFWRA
eukprot:1526532-Rhodomonas_salina.2